MRDFTIVVCGHGRCGTSLMMQMLAAAGVHIAGEYPSYEAEKFCTPEWISRNKGGAIKLLDPMRFEHTFGIEKIKFIWISRNVFQQAESTSKFASMLGGLPLLDKQQIGVLAASLARDTAPSITRIRNYGTLLTMTFEQMIEKPEEAAQRLVDYCLLPSSTVAKMGDAVLPRDAKCQPNLDIEVKLMGLEH